MSNNSENPLLMTFLSVIRLVKRWNHEISVMSSKTESFEINNQQISRKSLSSQYGVDFDLSQKIFLFFSKQSKTIKTYNQTDLFAIIAGIITFAPDRRYNLSQHAQNGKFMINVLLRPSRWRLVRWNPSHWSYPESPIVPSHGGRHITLLFNRHFLFEMLIGQWPGVNFEIFDDKC